MGAVTETETEPTIGTGAALRLIGLRDMVWRNAVQQGTYPSPPELDERGRRDWGLDDLVCARWFASNLKAGMTARLAGECSHLLLARMQELPDASEFHVYAFADGDKGELRFLTAHVDAPGAEHVFTVPIARWRVDMQRALDRVLAKRGNGTTH